jgi:hypothetical protein
MGVQAGITAMGQGEVSAAPELARLTVGVEATSPTVAGAMAEATKRSAAINQTLRAMGVAEDDIKTAGFTLFPERPGYWPHRAARLLAPPTQCRADASSAAAFADAAAAAFADAAAAAFADAAAWSGADGGCPASRTRTCLARPTRKRRCTRVPRHERVRGHLARSHPHR